MIPLLHSILFSLPLLAEGPPSMRVHEPVRCVFREGDSASWAQPGFDDSAWNTEVHRGRDPILWQRCHFDPINDAVPGDFDLQFRVMAAWIVYVDGRQAATSGDPQSGWYNLNNLYQAPISDAAAASRGTVVAIRMTRRYTWDNLFLWNSLQLPPALGSHARLELRGVQYSLGKTWGYGLPFFAGIVLLILYSADRERRDTLYLGIIALGSCLFPMCVGLPSSLAPVSYIFDPLCYFTGRTAMLLFPFFVCAFRKQPMPRFALVAAGVLLAYNLVRLLLLPLPAWIAFPANEWANSTGPLLVVHIVTLVAQAPFLTAFLPLRDLRRHEIPIFAAALLVWLPAFLILLGQYPGLGHLLVPAVIAGSIVHGVVLLYFFALIAFRYHRLREDRAVQQAAMRAAAEVQRRLIPEQIPNFPGFSLEAAYLPASEVGGDFYQVLAVADGSLLAVVGDVSGKGLDAAMLVAAIIGALRGGSVEEPGGVMAYLNRSLAGKTSGGFVTCCCARIHADGAVKFASAGHLAPYVDGEEIAVEAGLPLGLVPDADWPESNLQLARGAQLTLISDGIIEAANAKGELFGFDRTRHMATRPAQAIAEAAMAWGQNDDITVVTVRRAV